MVNELEKYRDYLEKSLHNLHASNGNYNMKLREIYTRETNRVVEGCSKCLLTKVFPYLLEKMNRARTEAKIEEKHETKGERHTFPKHHNIQDLLNLHHLKAPKTIAELSDLDVLHAWLTKENRPSVKTALQNRIKEL